MAENYRTMYLAAAVQAASDGYKMESRNAAGSLVARMRALLFGRDPKDE
jgi:hypothetical protein